MAKQKMKTVNMSATAEELEATDSAEAMAKAEAARLKELEAAEKAEKKAKKAAKAEKAEEIQEKIEAKIEENIEEEIKRVPKNRSKKYHAAKNLVDRSKTYVLKEAVELMKKTSYTRFTGTVVADIVTKDDKVNVDITFPHSTGRVKKVVIATDAVLADIESGKIDFDILVAAPNLMPKLAKLAKILGPKGLMPNPKNGTLTPNTETKKKELEGGKVNIKCEKKMPLLHVVLGKADQASKELIENTEKLINGVGPKKCLKLVLSATMGPGIKVDLTPYQQTV